jgi:hypothetical protein
MSLLRRLCASGKYVFRAIKIIIGAYFGHKIMTSTTVYNHHYQPINIPTAGTKAFLMDHT